LNAIIGTYTSNNRPKNPTHKLRSQAANGSNKKRKEKKKSKHPGKDAEAGAIEQPAKGTKERKESSTPSVRLNPSLFVRPTSTEQKPSRAKLASHRGASNDNSYAPRHVAHSKGTVVTQFLKRTRKRCPTSPLHPQSLEVRVLAQTRSSHPSHPTLHFNHQALLLLSPPLPDENTSATLTPAIFPVKPLVRLLLLPLLLVLDVGDETVDSLP
jgi:hypothetical protein